MANSLFKGIENKKIFFGQKKEAPPGWRGEEAKARIRLLQQEQQHRNQSTFDDEQWREAIRQYADITELDAVTLNKLVRQVVVHEEIGEEGARKISVEIYFNMRQPG